MARTPAAASRVKLKPLLHGFCRPARHDITRGHHRRVITKRAKPVGACSTSKRWVITAATATRCCAVSWKRYQQSRRNTIGRRFRRLTILRDITAGRRMRCLRAYGRRAHRRGGAQARRRQNVLGQYSAKIHDAARALPGAEISGGDISGHRGVDDNVRFCRHCAGTAAVRNSRNSGFPCCDGRC